MCVTFNLGQLPPQRFGGLGDRGMMDGMPQLCLFRGYSHVDKVPTAVSHVQACFC